MNPSVRPEASNSPRVQSSPVQEEVSASTGINPPSLQPEASNSPGTALEAQTESHKEMLTNLQSTLELKIARKIALETELRNLSAEIEANEKKIAELPGLIEKTQEEASAAMIEANQLEAQLSVLSNTQKDYQERLKNINQIISNASSVIAKYLNI
jgi:chromosome segregation ATPase